MSTFYVATVVFALVSVVLVRRWLPPRYAVPVIGFKFILPLFYRFLSGRYLPRYNEVAGDSWYSQTNRILDEGHTPVSLLLDGFAPIESMMGTTDPFYWWWTAVWLTTIENTVYAPLLANVFVLVIASVVFTALLDRLAYDYRYQQLFLVFSLLHWEVVTWSSIFSHKDPLMALLTVSALYLIVAAVHASTTRGLLGSLGALGAVLWVIPFVRWYITAILLVAVALWLALEWTLASDRIGVPHVAFAGVFLPVVFLTLLTWGDALARISVSDYPIGLFRIAIGPVPGGTAPEYGFLNFVSVFHWLLAPAAVVGAATLARGRYERLLLIYAVLLVLVYAGAVDSPRFRLQIVLIVALAQFHGLWFMVTRRYEVSVRT